MINFFKNAIRELQHVVWPTKAETKKYFLTVLAVLVMFWCYLFVVNSVFSNILFTLKEMASPMTTSLENKLPNFDVSSIKTKTGEVIGTGTTSTWVTQIWKLSQTWTVSDKKTK